MRATAALLVGLLFTPTIAARAAAPPLATLAFVDVTVVPMDRAATLAHQTVLVGEGRIAAVGPVDGVPIPPTARRIDGRGRFLIPGLTDTHVHLISSTELPLYLANGVTTVFNLDGRPAHLRWRARVARGELPGPTIFTSGPIFASAHTPAEAVRMVDQQAAAGYDAVKIYNQVSAAEYPALIAEAKKRHLLLMGHVAREPGFETTVRLGQSIAHLEELTYSFFQRPGGDGDLAAIDFDESRIPLVAAMLATSGVSVTATLSMFRDIVRQATALPRYLQNPELRYLPAWLRAHLEPGANKYDGRYPPETVAVLRRSLAFQRLLVRALADAGVPLMTGTDTTTIGPVSGFSLHEELEELVASGLTPWQALRASTVNPARYFGVATERGTIEAGKRADLVLLSADPLAAIANSRAVAGVVAAGRYYDAPQLRHLVDAIATRYADELTFVVQALATDPPRASAYLADNDPSGGLTSAALARLIDKWGVARLRKTVAAMRRSAADGDAVGEDAMNTLGYDLLGRHQTAQAIAVLAANVEDFPRSANALDSLAEAYAKTGAVDRAVQLYAQALDLDARYVNAPFARRFLVEHQHNP